MNKEERLQLHHCLSLQEPLNGSNLRTLFNLLTKAHYSDPDNYGYLQPQLNCFKYSSDKGERTLDIQLSHNYDILQPLECATIYVGMDTPFNFKKTDVANVSAHTPDNSAAFSGFIVATSVSFIHTAREIDQALLLADSTASYFLGIGDSIKSRLNLAGFNPVTISAPLLVEKEPEKYFRVDVMFDIAFNYSVLANIESHRLKKFAMEFIPTET